MKDIVLRIMKRLLAEVADSPSELHIYDFDDTLVQTDSHVYLTTPDGKRRRLTPHEYAVYAAGHGDTFDYSDFEKVINPRPIMPMVDKMKDSISKLGVNRVFVLTARGNPQPVRDYLSTLGITGIRVFAVGTSNPIAKANVIRNEIVVCEPKRVLFYDDSPKYINSVRALEGEFPGVEIITIQV